MVIGTWPIKISCPKCKLFMLYLYAKGFYFIFLPPSMPKLSLNVQIYVQGSLLVTVSMSLHYRFARRITDMTHILAQLKRGPEGCPLAQVASLALFLFIDWLGLTVLTWLLASFSGVFYSPSIPLSSFFLSWYLFPIRRTKRRKLFLQRSCICQR